MFSCLDGFTLSENVTLLCGNMTWSGELPQCYGMLFLISETKYIA